MNINQKQIALFGTSADPPTCGHQALLEGLLKLFPKVVTWASDNPMKLHGESLKKRTNLLNTLVKTIANPNLEMVQELSSPWTITTLKKASFKWPGSELIFVIGSDLAEQIPNWVEAKAVVCKVRLGIAPRQGWPLKKTHLNKLKALGAEIDVLPLEIPASASSNIRNNLGTKNIPPALLPLLLEENLYGFNTNL